MPRFLSLFLKSLLVLVVVALLAVGGALLALRQPGVQTRLAHEAADFLTKRLGYPVQVGRVDVRPFSRVLLEQVRVLDRQGGELFNIGRAEADITLFSVLDPRHLHVGRLTLDEPRFALITYPGQPDSTNLTGFLTAIQRLIGPSDTTQTKQPFDFKIEAIRLRNGQFVLDDRTRPREPYYGRTMDYAHMRLDSIYGDLSAIRLQGDTIFTQISGLRTVDRPSGTRLRELTAAMTYASRFWEFDKLKLRVQNSQLSHYVRFEYKHFLNFTDFNDSVKVIARLSPSRVYSDDIAKFAPQDFMQTLHETVLISGEAKGYVRNFTTRNLDVQYGRATRVRGNINVEGLPNLAESFVEMRLQPSVIVASDIRRYIPAEGWPYVQRLGTVRLRGQFLGFYNDFVANGSFQTALGSVVSDVNLKFKTDPRYSSYEGRVATQGFQLGKLLGDESLVRDVTMNGRVAGVGFTPAGARLQANATVQSIWLQGYRYRNITTDGQFRRQAFAGKLAIDDPHLQATADGSVDLNPSQQAFDLRARIRRADLHALGLTPQRITVSTTADVRFQGLQLDRMLGRVQLRQSKLSLGGQTAAIDTLDVFSHRDADGQRRLMVRSEVANLTAVGNFNYTRVLKDVQVLLTEYRLNFESDEAATAAYYRRKRRLPTPEYAINLEVYLKKPNPVLRLFVPGLQVADYSRIDGSFRNGNTSIFSLGGHFDALQYDSVRTYNTDFDFTTSKLPYQPEVLAQASVTSQRQRVPGLGATQDFYVEGVWDQERINFSTSLAQTGSTNRAQINGGLVFLPQAVQVVFRQSGLNLLGKDWTIAADNSLVIRGRGREIEVQNLNLSNGAQSISAQGQISEDPTQLLRLVVQNFELNTLAPLTNQSISGRVNAVGDLRGVYGPLVANARLDVDSLTFDKVLIGDVAGVADWDNAARLLRLSATVLRDQQRLVALNGTYKPSEAVDQLNLTAVLNNAPVRLAQPLLSFMFSDLGGQANGTLRLTGRLAAPNLIGNLDVTDGRLRFDYLGTTYTFADRIRFQEDRISLRNIRLRDALGNYGTLDGNIYHRGFEDMRLALSASFRKLQVLNTTRKDNDLYFGTAFATGTARVSGPTDDLEVTVTARSEDGTRFSLPLDNAAKAEQASYIRFVNRNLPDTARTKKVPLDTEGKVDLSGLRLNMNLDITPDAYVEILLNESTGDVIRGTASGQLRLNIDTRGEFNMYGQVEIVRGLYNFTLQGLVNKEFQVRPGGTISWNGDPLQGQMNVTAIYTQRTSLAPIIPNSTATVPVTAVMTLTGPLLLPVIQLNLEFNDIPSSSEGELTSFITSLRNDEQELNRQVFSLIVFRQLTSPGSLAGVGRFAGSDLGVGNSVGQILSTQLGLLTAQIDPNLEIAFNISGVTPEELQALQVRLSYNLLGGRLRLTREGGFNNGPVTNSSGTVIAGAQSSLVGDLSLEYFLREDGKLRLRLRYETTARDFNQAAATNNPNQSRAGMSMLHTEQFNSLRELLARKRLRRREEASRKARELNIDDDPRTVVN